MAKRRVRCANLHSTRSFARARGVPKMKRLVVIGNNNNHNNNNNNITRSASGAFASSSSYHPRRHMHSSSRSSSRGRRIAVGARAVAVPTPPDDFNYREKTAAATVDVLLPRLETGGDSGLDCDVDWEKLIRRGELVYVKRRDDYVERRTDGYEEPREVVILGTNHTSADSAKAAAALIQSLKPDCVVVELCRSRSGLLQRAENDSGGNKLLGMSSTARSGEKDEGGYASAVLRAITLGGNGALLLRLLLQNLLDKVGIGEQGAEVRIPFRARTCFNLCPSPLARSHSTEQNVASRVLVNFAFECAIPL